MSPATAASSVNRLGTAREEKVAEVGMTKQRDHERNLVIETITRDALLLGPIDVMNPNGHM